MCRVRITSRLVVEKSQVVLIVAKGGEEIDIKVSLSDTLQSSKQQPTSNNSSWLSTTRKKSVCRLGEIIDLESKRETQRRKK
jgi:hypothetical protein